MVTRYTSPSSTQRKRSSKTIEVKGKQIHSTNKKNQSRYQSQDDEKQEGKGKERRKYRKIALNERNNPELTAPCSMGTGGVVVRKQLMHLLIYTKRTKSHRKFRGKVSPSYSCGRKTCVHPADVSVTSRWY